MTITRSNTPGSRCARPRSWVVALAFAGVLAGPVAAAQERYEGRAYAAGTDRLLYRETHWLYRGRGIPSRLVLYRCPSGEAFARKRIRESPSAIAPDFDFIDARTGYREGVRTRGGVRQVYWRKSAGAPPRVKPLQPRPNAVIDAGFDAFIRSRWEEMSRKAPVVASFLLPSRFDYLEFKIDKLADATVGGQRVRRLRMGLDRWYAFALPEVELTYATADRKLLRFQGIGTIRDSAGRNQNVRIEFPAGPNTTGVAQSEIDAAANMPLVSGCKT